MEPVGPLKPLKCDSANFDLASFFQGAEKSVFLSLWGVPWGRLGAVLGRFGAVLGPSWAALAPSWAVLGPSWRQLGPPWADFGGVPEPQNDQIAPKAPEGFIMKNSTRVLSYLGSLARPIARLVLGRAGGMRLGV